MKSKHSESHWNHNICPCYCIIMLFTHRAALINTHYHVTYMHESLHTLHYVLLLLLYISQMGVGCCGSWEIKMQKD